ncbi:MAG: RHS repeat-associated core domain-containing protein [Verrucomicrobia bacterium]|nr:RHS repeat-associated core domain-containing protein [Verrucomicrobiota bacterium]
MQTLNQQIKIVLILLFSTALSANAIAQETKPIVKKDSLGRCISVSLDGESERTYSYIPFGKLASASNEYYQSTFSYDPVGRIAKHISSHLGTVHYEWDQFGSLNTLKYPSNHVLSIKRDTFGREISISYEGSLLARMDYLEQSNLCRKITYGNGWKTTYQYLDCGLIKEVAHLSPLQEEYRISFEYSPTGQCISRSIVSPSGGYKYSYLYDPLDRLIAVYKNNALEEEYIYDPVGNRIKEQIQGVNKQWNYNSDLLPIQAGHTCMLFNQSGQLSTFQDESYRLKLEYDSEGHLISIDTESDFIQYEYDALGLRVCKQTHQGNDYYLYDVAGDYPHLLMHQQPNGKQTRYFVSPLMIFVMTDSEVKYLFREQPNGGIWLTVNSEGTVEETRHTTAFGFSPTEISSQCILGAFGEIYDQETDFVYLKNRYYSPRLGRFISPDPVPPTLEEPQSWNSYAYARNDPINYWDPWGLDILRVYVIPRMQNAPVVDKSSILYPPICRDSQGHGWIDILTDEGKIIYSKGNLPYKCEDEGTHLQNHTNYKYRPFGISTDWHISPKTTAYVISQQRTIVTDYRTFTLNCISAVKVALDAAGIQHPSFRNAWGISHPNPLYEWVQRRNQHLAALNVQSVGGICLSATAQMPIRSENLLGVNYDIATGQLLFLTPDEVRSPALNSDDLAVAVRSLYGLGESPPSDPGVSIGTEPSDKEGFLKVTYQGETRNTRFGQVLFEADAALKSLMIGHDIITGQPLPSIKDHYSFKWWTMHPGLVLFADRSGKVPDFFTARMWLEPKCIELALSEDQRSLIFTNVSMIAKNAYSDGYLESMKVLNDGAARQFTEHYDRYAEAFPVLAELKELSKITALVKWLRDTGLSFDTDYFQKYTVPYHQTPDYCLAHSWEVFLRYQTPIQYRDMVSGRPITLTGTKVNFIGGINLQANDLNTLYTRSSSSQCFEDAKFTRPSDSTLQWSFLSGNQRLQSTARQVTRTPKDGNLNLSFQDLSFSVRGDFPLALCRSYDSFNDFAEVLGKGWLITPYRLQFPDRESQQELRIYVLSDNGVDCFSIVEPTKNGIYENTSKSAQLTRHLDGTFSLKNAQGTAQFDSRGYLTARADLKGYTIYYYYQESQLIKIEHQDGQKIDLVYGDYGPKIIYGPGNSWVAYEYNGQGSLIQVKRADGSSYQYEYDESERLCRIIDPMNHPVLSCKYDIYNRMIQLQMQNDESKDIRYDICTGTVVSDLYSSKRDVYGRLINIDNKVTYNYDKGMLPTTVTIGDEKSTQLSYTENHLLSAISNEDLGEFCFFYSEDHLLQKVDCGGGRYFRYLHDRRGNVTDIYLYDPSLDHPLLFAKYEYNEFGDCIRARSIDHPLETYAYNASGQLFSVTSHDGQHTHFTYDERGRVTHVLKNHKSNVKINYDAMNRIISLEDDLGIDCFDYDLCGQLIVRIDGLGHRTSYFYDNQNRLVKVIDPIGQNTCYNYNSSGELATAVLPNGREILFEQAA